MRWIALGLLAFSLSATLLHAENKVVSMFADVYVKADGKDELQGSAKYTRKSFDSMEACEAFRVSQEALDSIERLKVAIISQIGIDVSKIELRCAEDE